MIDNEFDLKITLRILNQKITKYINENPQNVVIFKIFSVLISFSVSIENHPRYPIKEYELFVYSCYIFPVIDPKEHINTI